MLVLCVFITPVASNSCLFSIGCVHLFWDFFLEMGVIRLRACLGGGVTRVALEGDRPRDRVISKGGYTPVGSGSPT